MNAVIEIREATNQEAVTFNKQNLGEASIGSCLSLHVHLTTAWPLLLVISHSRSRLFLEPRGDGFIQISIGKSDPQPQQLEGARPSHPRSLRFRPLRLRLLGERSQGFLISLDTAVLS